MKVEPYNQTLNGQKPLDQPVADRPHRLYYALTNHCNRACPWCCTFSSPAGKTFITEDDYLRFFPEEGEFEVQLEGGEPTLHPLFDDFVSFAVNHPRCSKIIIVSNGVTLATTEEELNEFLLKLGNDFTLKLSINHFLLDRDSQLFEKAKIINGLIKELSCNGQLVLNVRLRRDHEEERAKITSSLEQFVLTDIANIFYLQRYGLAENEETWEEPFIVGDNFNLINPDGRSYGCDLIKRSKAMGELS